VVVVRSSDVIGADVGYCCARQAGAAALRLARRRYDPLYRAVLLSLKRGYVSNPARSHRSRSGPSPWIGWAPCRRTRRLPWHAAIRMP